MTAVVIPRRVNGPPTTANGGYACGVVAGTGPTEVTLRKPPPLDTELTERDGDVLDQDGDVVLSVRPADGAELRALADAAPRVSLDAARAAGAATPLVEGHPFPTCFGCGADHPTGLHCLAGPVEGDVWAVTFTPDATDPKLAWAALDCPSAAPHMVRARGVPHLLGRMAAEVYAAPESDVEHAVVAWPLGSEGRRRIGASAILDADGDVLAVARATWVVPA
jgi:hypothetical protein